MKRCGGILTVSLVLALSSVVPAVAEDSAESVLGTERMPPVTQQVRPVLPTRADAPRALVSGFRGLIGGCRVVGWYNCAALGDHYLNGQGADYRVELGDVARADPVIAERLDDQLRNGVMDALAEADRGSEDAVLQFDSGWQAASAASGDWLYALGTFSVRTTGTIRVESADATGDRGVHVTYEMYLVDVYDFAHCRGPDPFCVYRHLADLGHAAEFVIYGASGPLEVATTERALTAGPLQVWR